MNLKSLEYLKVNEKGSFFIHTFIPFHFFSHLLLQLCHFKDCSLFSKEQENLNIMTSDWQVVSHPIKLSGKCNPLCLLLNQCKDLEHRSCGIFKKFCLSKNKSGYQLTCSKQSDKALNSNINKTFDLMKVDLLNFTSFQKMRNQKAV